MLTKRIIPCLDIKDGRTVKGINFVNLRDAGDPVELATRYTQEGADELVFLDITASNEQRETIKDLVRKVASVINIPFTVGGGVKSVDDARNILLNGADKVGINTSAIKNPPLITELMTLFGRQCVVVAIDAKRNHTIKENVNIFLEEGKEFWFEVFIYGGKEGTGIDVINWAKEAEQLGAGEILLTSIDADGTKNGYDVLLTKSIVENASIPVIASGGVGHLDHLVDGIKLGNASAVLAASIFHYGKHSVKEAKEYLDSKGIPVRI